MLIASVLTPITIAIKSNETLSELISFCNNEISYSSWPVHKHDAQRTGRSPYDTSNNHGGIKWKCLIDGGFSLNSVVIDSNKTLYTSTHKELIAVDNNGNGKWIVDTDGFMCGSPAVGPEGTIYIGNNGNLLAYNPDSSTKWSLDYEHNFMGNPTVGPNGTLYATTNDGYLYAINPNGTVKWRYIDKNDWCTDAAIDHIGNVYYGTSFENSVYCLSPNGSLNWKYRTDYGINYCPVISDGGTIYARSTHYLIALNPDKTEKWKIWITDWGGGNPSLAPDGTIILSGGQEYITAINPEDGGIIWQYQIPNIHGGVDDVTEVVIGNDGTIFFAYTHNVRIGFLCALSSDGDFIWETQLVSDINPYQFLYIISEPSIGEDGTIYITTDGSYQELKSIHNEFGYLYAINKQNPSPAPGTLSIAGENNGKVRVEYNYSFKATSPTGDDIYYVINWGDGTFEQEVGPFNSDEEITVSHVWDEVDSYVISARAKSLDDLCGPWKSFSVTITPKNKEILGALYLSFLEQFPSLPKLFLLLK